MRVPGVVSESRRPPAGGAAGPRERARAPLAAGDALRGCAALAVVAGHVVGVPVFRWNREAPPGQEVTVEQGLGIPGQLLHAGGLVGVSVFFVLSGYLLSRPFVRAFLLGERRPSVRRYLRNRALRLFPAFWAVLTIVLVLFGAHGLSPSDVLRLYLFAGDWFTNPLVLWIGQAWTLDVEARFYLLLGGIGTVLVLLGRRTGPRLGPGARVAALAVLVCATGVVSAMAYAGGDGLLIGLAENVGRFMPGVALAVAETTRLPALRGRGPALAAVAAFLTGLTALVAAAFIHDAGAAGGLVASAVFLGAGAVVAGPLLWQWTGRRPWRALDNAPLRWAGSRSYSIYLVHFVIFSELTAGHGYRWGALLLALVGVPVTFLAAELLHRGVEQPALRRRAPSQVVPGGWLNPARAAPARAR